MLGNAIPQLDSSLKGIDLFWTGPLSWVYSPGGWNIQRRKAPLRKPQTCAALDQAAIERIRMTSEQRITFGWVSWRGGSFNSGNPSTITIHNPVTPAEIFTLNLD